MSKILSQFLAKNIKVKLDFKKLIEKPKNPSHGDFSFPVFLLSKEYKKAPIEIAKELKEELNKKLPKSFSKVEAMGPYLNFYLDNVSEIKDVLKNISNKKAFQIKNSKREKILMEYPSPNTNKSLHIGHVRNILLGNSISKLQEEIGNKVFRINLNNDRGIAICKAMLMYKLFGENKTPIDLNMAPDKFVESFYVMFKDKASENPKLEDEALKMLENWEKGDKETIKLWEKLLGYVYEGYKYTYSIFNLKFDKQYFESEIYDKGKEIVGNGVKNKVEGFEKDKDGAVFVDFKNKTYGKKYLLRGNGTTLYMTQDLYLASLKEKEFNADKYIFVVGSEQKYHFEVLFQLLDRLKIAKVENNYHLSYGYVYDKDGKKFSSRSGKVIRANELYEEIYNKAISNLKNKELTKNLNSKELNRRGKIIAFSALSFGMLKTNPQNDIHFDLESAISFEGETGPYILYTCARINSILNKASYKLNLEVDYNIYSQEEIEIIKLLNEYKEIIIESATKYKPSHLAQYLLRISKSFNEFYQKSQILKEEESIKQARLLMCFAILETLTKGLSIFGIEVLEEM